MNDIKIKEAQQKHYDQMFLEYEEKIQQSTYMRLLRSKYTLDRWAGRLEGKRILDLGCGPGNTALKLVQRSCQLTGLDISLEFVKHARQQVQPYREASWVQSDAENLPLANESFDVVVSMGTLHHLPNPEKAVREISRLLRPGGWLLAMEPNATPYPNSAEFYAAIMPVWLGRKLRTLRAARNITRSKAEVSEFHVGLRTPAQYESFLQEAGFTPGIKSLTFPLFPFTVLNLNQYKTTWQVAIWLSQGLAFLAPGLRGKELSLIIEAQKTS